MIVAADLRSVFAVLVDIVDVDEGARCCRGRIINRARAELRHLGSNQNHTIAGGRLSSPDVALIEPKGLDLCEAKRIHKERQGQSGV